MDQEESAASDRNAVRCQSPTVRKPKKQDSIYHSFKDVAIFILVIAIAGQDIFITAPARKEKLKRAAKI